MSGHVGTRGLTFGKLEQVRLLLHQLCSDEDNPRSLTAVLMAERGVTSRDVEVVCRVARDALEAFRGVEIDAMDEHDAPIAAPVSVPPPTAPDGHDELRRAIEESRAKALGAMAQAEMP